MNKNFQIIAEVAYVLEDIPHPLDVVSCIISDFNLTPVIAIEKEFYVKNNNSPSQHVFDLQRASNLLAQEPIFEKVVAESGEGQLEFSTYPTSDIVGLLRGLTHIEKILNGFAWQHGLSLNWDTMPISGQPGNGIHVNLSLHDSCGYNVLQKDINNESNNESLPMLYVISGLLNTLNDFMLAYAPTSACYQRYIEPPFPTVFFSPTRISWGADNRATAIRIPSSSFKPETRRVEHRVAGGSACIEKVLSSVLIGVYYGLIKSQIPQYPKTYGFPSNPIFDLPKLPSSLDAAFSNFINGGRFLCSIVKRTKLEVN